MPEQYQLVPTSYLKRIDQTLSDLKKFMQGTVHAGWVHEAKFKEITGIKEKSALKRFRQNNPALWKAQTTFMRGNVTCHRGFMYNLNGYYELFSSPGTPLKV